MWTYSYFFIFIYLCLMYLIDLAQNKISKPINKVSFSNWWFKERQHLQERIAQNPDVLGEKLLIVQKEFDGFEDTNERLDLLALDTKWNIVVIENKLDDTGRDVVRQALKYASYTSTLTKEQIRQIFQSYLDKQWWWSAIDELTIFFDNIEYEELTLNQWQSQRIILVAWSFRKEVTSTALWLINFNIAVQCFKVGLFELDGKLMLDIEQIIPTKDAADYIISMGNKHQEERSQQSELKDRHHIRSDFWKQLLPQLKGKTLIYQNTSPSKDHRLSSWWTGISWVHYNFLITKWYVGIELAITRNTQEENKSFFDLLLSYKDRIEKECKQTLSRERMDNKKCRELHIILIEQISLIKNNDLILMNFWFHQWLCLKKSCVPFLLNSKNKFNNSFYPPPLPHDSYPHLSPYRWSCWSNRYARLMSTNHQIIR